MKDYLEHLSRWAEKQKLYIRTTSGTQREPENIVAICEGMDPTTWTPVIISRSSLDSKETAAMYVVNALERLGVNIWE